jgi:hypothetical protein
MGRLSEAMIEEYEEQVSVAGSRTTYIRYSRERDLPMLLAIRNATFISHGQMFEQLVATGSEVSRRACNWRIQRLVRAGVVSKMPPQLPYSGPVYTISRSGLACLESCGQGLMKEWTGDLEIRSINQSIDLPLAKDYDVIVELEFDGFSLQNRLRIRAISQGVDALSGNCGGDRGRRSGTTQGRV